MSIDDRYCSQCGAIASPLTSASIPPASSADDKQKTSLWPEHERKHVTVLFADIVGSTSHIQHLDPEAALAYLDRGLKIMTDAVHQNGGTICRVDGDGIFALFGAPTADEDHAVLACYAALEIQEFAKTSTEWKDRIRVGICSGEVVVSTKSVGFSVGYQATGVTVHLASRLQSLCKPGSICISASTSQLIAGHLFGTPIGKVSIRGLDSEVECFEITGRPNLKRGWRPHHVLGLSPFVGRIGERQFAKDLMEHVTAGRGKILSLVGEPGIGKSRLAFEIASSCRSAHWTVVETAAPHFDRSMTLFPIRQFLRRVIGIDDLESASAAVTRARDALVRLAMPSENLAPLISLLELYSPDEQWHTIEPQERRRRSTEFFVRFVQTLCRHEPALLIVEDLQWIDVESYAVLDRLVSQTEKEKLLVLFTMRPEFKHDWSHHTYYHELCLETLDIDGAAELVDKLLGYDASVQSLRQLLPKWTGGTPLFIEEMVRSLHEEGTIEGEIGNFRSPRLLNKLRAPATLQSVITSRIDRLLPDEKLILQAAAVVGERVYPKLLRELTGFSMRKTNQLIGSLVDRGLLQRAHWPERRFAIKFKHSITQNVTYHSILKQQRRVMHAKVLSTIELQFGDRLKEHIEDLARQARLGKIWTKSAFYYNLAADAAVNRSGNTQAINFFKEVLAALDNLPDDRQFVEQRLDAELGLRRAYGAVGASREAFENLTKCEELAKALNDNHRIAEICILKTTELCHQGAIDLAIAAGKEATKYSYEDSLKSAAAISLSLAYYHHGSFELASETLRKTADTIVQDQQAEPRGASSTLSVRCLGLLAGSLATLGDFDGAFDAGERALAIAEETRRPIDIGTACYFMGFANSHGGKFKEAIRYLKQGYNACHLGNVDYMIPWLSSELGLTLILSRRDTSGRCLLDDALRQCNSMNLLYGRARTLVRYSQACLLLDEVPAAHEQALRAIEIARKYHYRAIEVWGLHMRGECKARQGHQRSSILDLNRALEKAQALHMEPDSAHLKVRLAELSLSKKYAKRDKLRLLEALDIYENLGMQHYERYTRRVMTKLRQRS